jgi:AraC family transcriptional activator of pobA
MTENCDGKNGLNDLKDDSFRSVGMDVFSSEDVIPKWATCHPFRSTAFAILLVTKGELEIQCDFVSCRIAEKELFFVLPEALYEIEKVAPNLSFIGLGFKRSYLKDQGIFFSSSDLLHLFSTDMRKKHSLSDEEFSAIQFHVLSLKRKMQLPAETLHLKEIIRHNFLSVLYEMFLIQSKNRVFSSIKLNRKEKLSSDFLGLLSENFKQHRKLEFYAKTLFVTPRHLSQVVKQVTGKTAGELIDELVIKEAKVLLSTHVLSIAQVTDLLNFSDQSFFGKFFKKHIGISPLMYKQQHPIAQQSPF